jgi:hypothetical protein
MLVLQWASDFSELGDGRYRLTVISIIYGKNTDIGY